MAIFHVQPLEIPLKQTFKQASSVRSIGESIWVEAKDGDLVGLGEGCPRQYVTGESISSSLEWINSILPTLEKIETFEQLNTFVNQNESELDLHPAAWCGLELALLDLLSRQENTTPEALFGLTTVENTSFAYTAVLSDSTIEKFNKRLVQFRE